MAITKKTRLFIAFGLLAKALWAQNIKHEPINFLKIFKMKTKQFCLTLLFVCLTIATFAQAQFTSAGIAAQGIVRDENNTAIQNKTIDLTFTFYYTTNSGETAVGAAITKSVVTDGFGVFSTIIDPGSGNNPQFSNNPVSLRITRGSLIISESLLPHVPYAISANNGVPTGAIMPFAGSVVPNGWALCNGDALPANATALKALLGSNFAPDLRGFFLRGAGANTVSGYTDNEGPALNTTQQDDNLFHDHLFTLSTSSAGSHYHTTNLIKDRATTYAGTGIVNLSSNADGGDAYYEATTAANNDGFDNKPSSIAGDHTHPITGSINSRGGSESRPINYGVNYLIKL